MKVRTLLHEGPFDSVAEAERFAEYEVGAPNPKIVPWIEGYGIEVDSFEDVETVYGYFLVKFSQWGIHGNSVALMHLEVLEKLPVDSECGASCVIVADKAADLLNWMNDVGDEARGQIIAAAAYQCLIFYTS